MIIHLLIRRSQVQQRPFKGLSRRKCDPRTKGRFAIQMQSVSGLPGLRKANDDLRWLGDFLDRHLLEIAQGILRLAKPTDSAAITQRKVIRPRPTLTGPADQAIDDPVLASLLQHADRLYIGRLWKANKRRINISAPVPM